MRPCGKDSKISERNSNIVKRMQTWYIVSVILVLLVIPVFTELARVETSIDGALFPGRDTYLNWAGGRYEILETENSKYYSLYRWQSIEGVSVPTCLSDHVIRFHVSDNYSYFEALEGFMVIDHSTHAFPFFAEFSDLALQYQSVFNQSSLFQSRKTQ